MYHRQTAVGRESASHEKRELAIQATIESNRFDRLFVKAGHQADKRADGQYNGRDKEKVVEKPEMGAGEEVLGN